MKAKIDDFVGCPIRELDTVFVKILEQRIKNEGYNLAKPLSVVQNGDGKLKVFDGNHRLAACQNLILKEIPYVEYPANSNIVKEAIRANRDEETSKPMTFLDYAFLCTRLHDEGGKDEDISKVLSDTNEKWGRTKVVEHRNIVEKLNPDALNLIKTCVANFSEIATLNNDLEATPTVAHATFLNHRMFRGIIPLNTENQLYIIQEIVNQNGKLKGQKLNELCERLKLHESMIEYVEIHLTNSEAKEALIADIKNTIYDKIEQVEKKVAELNKEAQRQLILGDAVVELQKIKDGYIDLVITDPPYGQKYVSNRKEIDYEEINVPIPNDQKHIKNYYQNAYYTKRWKTK